MAWSLERIRSLRGVSTVGPAALSGPELESQVTDLVIIYLLRADWEPGTLLGIGTTSWSLSFIREGSKILSKQKLIIKIMVSSLQVRP